MESENERPVEPGTTDRVDVSAPVPWCSHLLCLAFVVFVTYSTAKIIVVGTVAYGGPPKVGLGGNFDRWRKAWTITEKRWIESFIVTGGIDLYRPRKEQSDSLPKQKPEWKELAGRPLTWFEVAKMEEDLRKAVHYNAYRDWILGWGFFHVLYVLASAVWVGVLLVKELRRRPPSRVLILLTGIMIPPTLANCAYAWLW